MLTDVMLHDYKKWSDMFCENTDIMTGPQWKMYIYTNGEREQNNVISRIVFLLQLKNIPMFNITTLTVHINS